MYKAYSIYWYLQEASVEDGGASPEYQPTSPKQVIQTVVGKNLRYKITCVGWIQNHLYRPDTELPVQAMDLYMIKTDLQIHIPKYKVVLIIVI